MTLPEPPVPADPLAGEIEAIATRLRLAERSAELDGAPEFPREEFRAMAREQLLGLRISGRLGGRGLPLRRAGRLLFALARLSGTTFAKLSLQPEFCSVLAEHGSSELVESYFRPLMAGEALIGNHVTEPQAGADAAALGSRAVATPTGYSLTGQKSEAAFAVDADAAIVYARVASLDASAGVTAFLVPQRGTGISRRSVPDMGERWMRRGSVDYTEVEVPRGHRIGEEGEAFGYLKDELTRERALLGAIYLGVARGCWEATVRHVGERRAFGRPLASQEAVGFPLAEDWARLDAGWLYVDRVLGDLDEDHPSDGPAALAKWLATETALTAIDHAVQFHGGRGYSKALPFEQRWRDVRSGALGHGPSEIMRVVAGRALWPREAARPAGSPAIPAPGADPPPPRES